jgi:hypothetical protein
VVGKGALFARRAHADSCNTALMQNTMFPLPKILAMATNATVYGTVGYD